jgi:hypothetical protein
MRRPPRKTVDQQLNMYLLAAGAAGVGLLALAQPSEAKIVYRPILVNIPPNTSYTLDLGLGPVPVLTLKNTHSFFVTLGQSFCGDALFPVASSGVAGQRTSDRILASALNSGVQIGPRLKFYSATRSARPNMAAVYKSEFLNASWGDWRNVTNRYLGIRFKVKGQFHYGWARLNVRSHLGISPLSCNVFATLTGYAYETVPNKPIIAGKTKGLEQWDEEGLDTGASVTKPIEIPQPATLGLLALGSPGLSIWRRKEPALQSN